MPFKYIFFLYSSLTFYEWDGGEREREGNEILNKGSEINFLSGWKATVGLLL